MSITSRIARALLAGAGLLVATVPPVLASEPIGVPPSYASAHALSEAPNAAAVDLRIWVPDLDAGDVPQGLTVLGDSVLVAAYRGDRAGTQDCRVHRFDVETGAHTGTADIPAACSHAGGMAVAGGRLFVTDTSALIELDPDALFDPTRREHAAIRSVSLRFPLRGSFAAGTDRGLWIGEYKRASGAAIRFVTLEAIDAAEAVAGLGPAAVEREIPAPVRAQGAAVGPDGILWVSASSSQFGRLYRLDAESGTVLSEFAAPDGTEDLGFDAAGRLWTVSEAGAEKYRNWPSFHPLVMRLLPSALR